MQVTIRRFGNSLGVILPSALIRELGLAEGQTLALAVAEQLIVQEPKLEQRYSRSALLALCDPDAPEVADPWRESN